MSYRRKRKSTNKELDYNLIIEYENLFHYEDLLIRRIDKIKTEYETKFGNSKIYTLISFFIPVLGYTNDVLGIRILSSIPSIKNIILYIALSAPGILSLYTAYRFKRLKESLDIEWNKYELAQMKIFFEYIIEKAKKQNILDGNTNYIDYDFKSKYDELVEHYFSGNKTQIMISKSDLKYYINDYLRKINKNIGNYEISTFLSEIIISRGLIKNKIKKSIYDDKFEYIIDKTNILEIGISLGNDL